MQKIADLNKRKNNNIYLENIIKEFGKEKMENQIDFMGKLKLII